MNLNSLAHMPWSRFIPHSPTGPQWAFLSLRDKEVLFGGAAGGGKSDALLMAALQYVDTPGYDAILFRRTFADLNLQGALIPRSKEWLLGTGAQWHDRDRKWTFPSGATLSFGYLDHEDDKYRYQSSEFQFIGFDELTQFQESQYLYLFSRLRKRADLPVPLRMRAASNPGGVGHDWVKDRFIDHPEGRVFVPAKIADNPHIDREQYLESLANLDPFTRAHLLNGDWTARKPGSLFRREWFRIVDESPVMKRSLRYWDLAATEAKAGTDPDWTVGARMGITDSGEYHLPDVRRMRGKPLDVERLVSTTATEDGRGVSIWMEQEPGSSGVNTIDHYGRTVLRGYTFRGDKVTGNKFEMMGPFSSAAEAGRVSLLRGPWNRAFLDEIESVPDGAHDDQADAASKAYAKLATRTEFWCG